MKTMTTLLILATIAVGGACAARHDDALRDGGAGTPCMPAKIENRFFPHMAPAGPFSAYRDLLTPNPNPPPVWVSNGQPAAPSGFAIPFRVGDRIVGLSIEVYGDDRDPRGAGEIKLLHKSSLVNYHEAPRLVAYATDKDRDSAWGRIDLSGVNFAPVDLGSHDYLWVDFHDVAEHYSVGAVTATFERPCRSP